MSLKKLVKQKTQINYPKAAVKALLRGSKWIKIQEIQESLVPRRVVIENGPKYIYHTEKLKEYYKQLILLIQYLVRHDKWHPYRERWGYDFCDAWKCLDKDDVKEYYNSIEDSVKKRKAYKVLRNLDAMLNAYFRSKSRNFSDIFQ